MSFIADTLIPIAIALIFGFLLFRAFRVMEAISAIKNWIGGLRKKDEGNFDIGSIYYE